MSEVRDIEFDRKEQFDFNNSLNSHFTHITEGLLESSSISKQRSKDLIYNDEKLQAALTYLIPNDQFGIDYTGIHIDCNSALNDIRYINQFLIKKNKEVKIGEYFVGRVEVLSDWAKKRNSRRIPVLGTLVKTYHFLIYRASPKIWGIRKIYFGITQGKGRVVSKAEILGRLVSCGFEPVQFKEIDGQHFFVAKKISDPIENKGSYGPVFKMERIGKGGKIIGVYKFRTMYPYSEFLQEYMINNLGYDKTGKIKDDFRKPSWSKFIRKHWLDEIPQLLNVLKGEMNLVGVRPVTKVYFDKMPEDLKQMRIKYKPGCIPPYVAFNTETGLESALESERRFLEMKKKYPKTTEIRLFFSAIFNIVIRGKRSA